LPIEINVEKNIGKVGDKVSAKEFRQACRTYAQKQVAGQREDFIRLGVLGDWQNPYLTMDYAFEANTIRALNKLIDNKYLVQGFKPVHWCFACQSSLAEAEVEYQDKTSTAIDVKFTVIDTAKFTAKFDRSDLGSGPISVLIWTTTPWTLPANYAVCLNPEFDYALVQVNGERWLIAHEMLGKVMERYGFEHYEVLALAPGKAFEHLLLQHPFLDQTSLLIVGDHVTLDAGTGAVHTAPAHGEDDFRVGKKYALPVTSPVQANGVFQADLPYFGGEQIFKANDHIIAILTEKNKLVKAVQFQHSYPHCWRHKTPVIFRATPQWFIGMNELAQKSLAELDRIQWKPQWGKERMAKMLDDRPDWCISRQRTWGVPIPLFTHKETQALHPNTAQLIEQVAKRVESAGIDAWFDLEKAELLGADADDYIKCTDVLDVWFDSGVTHFCVLKQREELAFPADMYLEGSDQYRGWFQTSLLTSIGINHVAPFKNLVTHGFVVDAQGRKMSKSLGNVIPPEKVVKSLGADILRLWTAATDYTREMTVSDEILKRNSDTYRRIRNTMRFLLSNLDDFNYNDDQVAEADMVKLDRWAVAFTKDLQDKIIDLYATLDFHEAIQTIHNFCSGELGSFYLDILKDRLYTCKKDGIARRSAQTAMYHILEAMVRWLAPVLSFTADEIWQFMPGKRSASVHLEKWYQNLIIKCDPEFDNEFWALANELRRGVNIEIEAKRAEKIIGSSLEANVIFYARSRDLNFLNKLKEELRFVFLVSDISVTLADKEHKGSPFSNIWPSKITKSEHPKCARCWHRVPLVEGREICERCVSNIEGDGEVRKFA
jgi:isoleucyl-tRNA synthetase